jgi:hypothetical protein
MKSIKRMALAAVLVGSLVGVSSASAATWDPSGTSLTATQVGTSTLNAGASVSCATGDANLTASGDLATLTGTTNPVRWGSCTNSVSSLLSTSVATAGTWTFTATSTTSVDIDVVNASGPVATITIGSPPFGCSITVPSPVHISGNTWDNSTHRLTVNSGQSFAVNHSGICPGVNSTGNMTATFQLPASAIIT